MRLKITLAYTKQKIKLPIHYNRILQGFIYSLFDNLFKKFLHQKGYIYQKRKFKLFTFSRLIGEFKIEENKEKYILFKPPISFFISSPKEEIMQNLAEGILRKEKLFLGKNEVFIESIEVMPSFEFKEEMLINMLSPITCYSTLKKADGKSKVYYYNPFEEEFSLILKNNLKKKYQLVFGKIPEKFDFQILPSRVNKKDEKIILYKKIIQKQKKSTVIKGWMGTYIIKGSPEILKLSYDAGLGSKNSQGFGCWEVWNEKQKQKCCN